VSSEVYLHKQLQWCSVCDPAKIFLTSKFIFFRFSNLTHKTKIGTANRLEIGMVKFFDQPTIMIVPGG
jgi:hypothetical protein